MATSKKSVYQFVGNIGQFQLTAKVLKKDNIFVTVNSSDDPIKEMATGFNKLRKTLISKYFKTVNVELHPGVAYHYGWNSEDYFRNIPELRSYMIKQEEKANV